MYSVEILPSAARALAKLEPATRRRIARRIDRLVVNPRVDALKLRGTEDVWRVRVGDYPVLYLIEDQRLIVVIVRMAHRREAYR